MLKEMNLCKCLRFRFQRDAKMKMAVELLPQIVYPFTLDK